MAYFEDLSPCHAFPGFEMLIAVGWLSPMHPFPTGPVEDEFLHKLVSLQATAIQTPFTHLMMGRHYCLFCSGREPVKEQVFDTTRLKLGRYNLFVPAENDRVYVSPSMMAHYVVDHNYSPPFEFQEAVLRCPTMRSAEYYQQMKKRGANIWSWLRFLKTTHLS